MLEKKKRGPVMKTTAPDDDPEFLRNLARKLDEQDEMPQNQTPQDEDPDNKASDDK
jgi:hypothetical protein